MKLHNNLLKRTVSLALCLSMLLSCAVFGVSAAEDYSGNLLQNPGFEDKGSAGIGSTVTSMPGGWVVKGGGFQKNNPHSGSYGFFLNNSTSYHLYQPVTIPYTGLYNTSAYIGQGGSGAKLGIRLYENGKQTVLKEITLPTGCGYSSAHTLEPVLLTQGDVVHIYAYGAKSWVNGDDFSFTYDFSNVFQNLLENQDLTQAVSIRAPWEGPYILTATVTAGEEDAVVALGETTATVAAGTTEDVKLISDELELNTMIEVSIGGAVSDAKLVFDVSSIPNEAPEASEVAVSGYAFSGESLSASYTFSDPDEGQKEGTSLYRWLACDSIDGEYVPIEGATGKNFTLTEAQENQYIKFEVTPVDAYALSGETVTSEAFGPVSINWVSNPGLETGDGKGWNFRNGASVYTQGNGHRGMIVAVLPANDADTEAAAPVSIERTGYYSASAWINLPEGTSTFGIRIAGSETPLDSIEVNADSSGFQLVTLSDVALEKGSTVEVYMQGNSGAAKAYTDDFALWIDGSKEAPAFANLLSFSAEQQIGDAKINTEEKTVSFTVPYGSDLTAINVDLVVSEGAVVIPSANASIDFSKPVTFAIINGNLTNMWTVICEEGEKKVSLESDNKTLEDGFNWAVNKTSQFVMTGIEDGTIDDGKSPNADYIPSYWAGYYNRTAFYGRDFVHQATGAELVGLSEENFSMFEAFAKSANESRKWYALWALNFDGSAYYMDYKSDTNFVREVPAQFELVEKAYKQFLWSGDERYISDEMFEFYTHVMVDYVALHDTNNNGVAEGTGGGIFSGSCTYNERGGQPIIEAGDAIGSQYQATLAYAGFCAARGDEEAAAEWYQKAADLKTYFNEEWGVMPGDEDGNYARALSTDGTTKYNDWGKENSWFMPLKMITEPGEKNDNFIDWIVSKLGNGIGSSGAPTNIEAYTYIPDMLFLYNRSDEAWRWMSYILSIKDKTHENASQGTNGDYPEISYTLVSQTVEGMMGVTPHAQNKTLTTVPRLPSDVGTMTLKNQEIGNNEIALTHNGNTESILTNVSGDDLTWTAQFYGEHAYILVNGEQMTAEQDEINGEAISYVTVPVEAGATVQAEAVSLEEIKNKAAEELEMQRNSYNDALYTDEQVEELDAALETGLEAIEAAENESAVAEAVEVAKDAMEAVKIKAEIMAEKAEAAKNAAEEAKAAAEAAQKDAADAKAKAEAAQAAAEKAREEAEAAQTAAEEAEKNAGKDASAAADAKAAADAAQAKAETAQRAAETAQAEAEAAQDKAKIAQTAAEAAAKAAEENNAAAAAEAAQAAKEAANAAEEALKSATSATESAASAAESASFAAKAAESAKDAQIAQKAAEEAQAKAEQAQKAAEEAQKAAEKAALDGAKYQAALNLDTYVNLVDQSEYDAKQVEALAQIVSDAKAEIDEAETTEEIDTILSETKLAIYAMDDVCPSKSYTDVAKNAWYHDYVDFMVENGYMNGVSNTLFDVDGSVTRAQLVTILYRVAGEPSVEGLNNPFTDVAEGKWYTDAIIWAAENGIVKGVSATEFAPDKEITREQIVTIVYRYDGEVEVAEEHLSAFHDTDKIANFAKAAMNWAVANGIMNGVTETTLAPDATATRAQICAIVMRYLEN